MTTIATIIKRIDEGRLLNWNEQQMAVAEIKRLQQEIGLTRERLDELDEPDRPISEFIPELVDNTFRRLFKAEKRLSTFVDNPKP